MATGKQTTAKPEGGDGGEAPAAIVPAWKFLRPGLALGAAVLIADLVSKWVILELVMDPPRVVPVLPGFNLILTYNRGVSFSLCDDCGRYVLSALALAVCAGLVWWLRKAETPMLGLAIGAIIGGALGNVVDRLRFGAVVDFLDVYVPGTDWPHWATFNVADSAVVLGVIFVLADGIFAGRAKT